MTARAVAPSPTDLIGPGRAGPGPSSGRVGGRLAGLDGIRAVAVVGVIAFHLGFRRAQGGFLGVSNFFTLSGFLITTLLLRSADLGINLRSFWGRRLRRLMPAAILCLVGVGIFALTAADAHQSAILPRQLVAAATYWQNWLLIGHIDFFGSPSPLQHFWSLAIEEQFYVFLPLVLWAWSKSRLSKATLAGVFAAGAVASTVLMATLFRSGAGLFRVYYGTDTRIAELLIGCVLAVVLLERGGSFSKPTQSVIAALSIVSLALIVAAFAFVQLTDHLIWRGGMFVYSLLSVALILGVLVDRGPAARLLALAPLAAIGRISYGLYLYHWPIIVYLTPDRTGLGRWPLVGLQVGVSLGAAFLSYRYVETPIRTYVRRAADTSGLTA